MLSFQIPQAWLKSCKLPVSPSLVQMEEKPANVTLSKHFVPPEESDLSAQVRIIKEKNRNQPL